MNRPIGIFDSGMGGISVLKQLLEVLPKENYFYYADEANLPYGDKSKRDIQIFTKKAFEFFEEKNVKLAILACNTATACAKDYLEENFDFPIMGVIDAGVRDKRLANKSELAILATVATISSGKYEEELKKNYPHLKAYGIACPGLADAIDAEDFEKTEELILEVSKKIRPSTDAVILACTHYPLVEDIFREIFSKNGRNLLFVDPALVLAKNVEAYIKSNLEKSEEAGLEFYSTKNLDAFKIRAGHFLKR